VVLTVDGKSYSQPLTIKMDPRVKTSAAALQKQSQASQQVYTHLLALSPAVEQATSLRKQLQEALSKAPKESAAAAALTKVNENMNKLLGAATRRPGPGSDQPTLAGLRVRYAALFNILQEVDDAPTTPTVAAMADLDKQLAPLMQQWQQVKEKDVPALNLQLKEAGLPELKIVAVNQAAKATVSAIDKDED
jgi:hypothetical protein